MDAFKVKTREVEVATGKGYLEALALLETMHLEYQSHALLHTLVHWKMLALAWKFQVWPELLGQIPRIALAAPGSLLGMAPRGNVGSTKMGIFESKKDGE